MITLIQIITWLCFIPSVIQVIRLVKNRKNEKHLSLKLVGNALFYEPFIAYELIKKAQKKYTNFNKYVIIGAGYGTLIITSLLIFVVGNSWYLVPAALGGLVLIVYQNYFKTKKPNFLVFDDLSYTCEIRNE